MINDENIIGKTFTLLSSSTRTMPAKFMSNNDRLQSFCIDFAPLTKEIEEVMASEAYGSIDNYFSNDKIDYNLDRQLFNAILIIGEDIMVGAFILKTLGGNGLQKLLKDKIIESRLANFGGKFSGIENLLSKKETISYLDYCFNFGSNIARDKNVEAEAIFIPRVARGKGISMQNALFPRFQEKEIGNTPEVAQSKRTIFTKNKALLLFGYIFSAFIILFLFLFGFKVLRVAYIEGAGLLSKSLSFLIVWFLFALLGIVASFFATLLVFNLYLKQINNKVFVGWGIAFFATFVGSFFIPVGNTYLFYLVEIIKRIFNL